MTRDRQQLVSGLHHLGYEVLMAAATAAERMTLAGAALADPAAPDGGTIPNALLESMLLHARSLIDFFVRPGGHPTDMRPGDFTLGAPEWIPAPRDAVDRALAAIPILNKHLAHLTWDRVEDGKQAWDPGYIVVDLMQIAEEWCNHLAQHDAELANQFRPILLQAYVFVVGPLPVVPAQTTTEPEGQNA